MCSVCKEILVDFRIPHSEASCPLRKSLYCRSCAIYGHSSKSCPVKPPLFATEPAFVEQLVPPSERRMYRITSRTPLTGVRIPEPTSELENPNLIEIKDVDDVIREYLRNHGVIVTSKKELRNRLREYAKGEGKVVRFIPSGHKTATVK